MFISLPVEAATGNGHGIDYLVNDYNLGVLTGAKAMAMTVIDLLYENADNGNKVVDKYKAPLTKTDYLSLLRGMMKEETYTE